jgi:hypothetical protein
MKMTLDEYLNQEKPVRMPSVMVKREELSIGGTTKFAGETRTQVFFDSLNPLLLGEYCIVNNGRTLMTTDDDGNPRRYSCFRIDFDVIARDRPSVTAPDQLKTGDKFTLRSLPTILNGIPKSKLFWVLDTVYTVSNVVEYKNLPSEIWVGDNWISEEYCKKAKS